MKSVTCDVEGCGKTSYTEPIYISSTARRCNAHYEHEFGPDSKRITVVTPDPAVGIDQGPGAVSEVEQRAKRIAESCHGSDYAEVLNGLLALVVELRQQVLTSERFRAEDAASHLDELNRQREWHVKQMAGIAQRHLDAEASLTALRREQEQLQQEIKRLNECCETAENLCVSMGDLESQQRKRAEAAEATGAAAVSKKDAEIERLRGELARVRQLLNDEVEYGPAHDD